MVYLRIDDIIVSCNKDAECSSLCGGGEKTIGHSRKTA